MINFQQVSVVFRSGFLCLGFAATATLAGCTEEARWVRPDTLPGVADQQLAACALEIETAYFSESEPKEQRTARIARWVSLCMKANGYRRGDNPTP